MVLLLVILSKGFTHSMSIRRDSCGQICPAVYIRHANKGMPLEIHGISKNFREISVEFQNGTRLVFWSIKVFLPNDPYGQVMVKRFENQYHGLNIITLLIVHFAIFRRFATRFQFRCASLPE